MYSLRGATEERPTAKRGKEGLGKENVVRKHRIWMSTTKLEVNKHGSILTNIVLSNIYRIQ